MAIPPPAYIDVVDQVYLQPRGFTGNTHGVFTWLNLISPFVDVTDLLS